MAQDTSTVGSSPLKAIVYWAIVGIPLGWGVYKTVVKSQPLFTGASATAPAAPAAAPAVATPAPLATAAPNASPFSTAQPSATVGPVDTPTVPKT